jgi:DNA polymerase-4
MAGQVVTLKLKRADFRALSRQSNLGDMTQSADRIYRTARALLDTVLDKGPFRLIGVGLGHIGPATQTDVTQDLLDPNAEQRRQAEKATDKIRARFGKDAIKKGRGLR